MTAIEEFKKYAMHLLSCAVVDIASNMMDPG